MPETVGKWGEVDLLVVGNHPGGAWLLSELPDVFSPSFRLGWLKENRPSTPLYVPPAAVQAFKLKNVRPVTSEILWPNDGLLWTPEEVARRFPKLSVSALLNSGVISFTANQWNRGALETNARDQITQVAKLHPELLGFADAFWKLFGRSASVHWETRLWNLFSCFDLGEWDPASQVPETTEIYETARLTSDIEAIRQTADGLWEVRIAGRGTLHAKYLVLSMGLSEKKSLEKAFQISRPPWEEVSRRAAEMGLFPFEVELEKKAVPTPMRGLTFLLDSADIPEPQTEIWPIERREKEHTTALRFAISGAKEICLDQLSQKFKQATLRLNRLLPFAARHVKKYSPGLEWDECAGDDKRAEVLDRLSQDFSERYAFSLMEPRTRWKTLFFVGPYFFTQWPYPFGELRGAQVIKTLLTPPKKSVTKAVPVATPPRSG